MVLRIAKPKRDERAAMKPDELLRTVWLLDDVIESFRWILVSERLPECEKEVEVTVERKCKNKTNYFTCRAIYEDGNIHIDHSIFNWYDFDIENERVPEGWFESVSYAEEFKGIDDFVIAWRNLSEPYKPD